MKAEELKSKIYFEIEDVGLGYAEVTGKLEVHATLKYDTFASDFLLEAVKEELRDQIMRHIYL